METSRRKLGREEYPVPPEEWALPAGYSADGARFVSLRERADGIAAVPHRRLTSEQLERLVAARIAGSTGVSALTGATDSTRRTGWRRSMLEVELIALDFICDAAGVREPA